MNCDGDAGDANAGEAAGHDIAAQFHDILQREQAPGTSAELDVNELCRSWNEPVRNWNQSVEQAKSDRRFGRMEEQAFRGIGISTDDSTIWDYASGDDDLILVQRVTEDVEDTDYFVHANVVDTAILQAMPTHRERAVPDCDLHAKEPRQHVPLSLGTGVVWLRKYKEVCKDGLELAGFQNNRRGNSAQKYWKLPVETGEPLGWWPVKAVAGHCRMKRVDGLSMCYGRVQSDWKKILDDYHEAMDQDGSDQCCCKQCKQSR